MCKRHLAAIIPAGLLGAFFTLPTVPWFCVVGAMVLGVMVSWFYGHWLTMTNSWLHVLMTNVSLSVIFAMVLVGHDLMLPFPDIKDWITAILEGFGLMFIFLILLAFCCWIH